MVNARALELLVLKTDLMLHPSSVTEPQKDFNYYAQVKSDGTYEMLLPKGKYRLRVWSMGDKGKKEMNLFADNGKSILKTPVLDTSWGSWGKLEIKDLTVDDGKLVIGLEVKASAGNWGLS